MVDGFQDVICRSCGALLCQVSFTNQQPQVILRARCECGSYWEVNATEVFTMMTEIEDDDGPITL